MSRRNTGASQLEIEEEVESIQPSQEEKKTTSQVPVKKGKQQKVVVVKPPPTQSKKLPSPLQPTQ